MYLVLMPLVFFAVLLDLVAVQVHAQGKFILRKAFLETSLLTGVFIALSSDLLSLIKGLTTAWVAVLWGGAFIIALGLGVWKGLLPTGLSYLQKAVKPQNWTESLIALGLILAIGLLFVIVVVAPPNNPDSLQYHMSRVMHWAQDQSLEHYITGFRPQLMNPIWAEEAILHFRLLWGDDRFAAFVQLFALIGSALGVSLLAGLAGAGRKGQILSALFSVSIPMGIMQATSTQNDYVVAFWLVTMACFVVFASQKGFERENLIFLGFACGLGLLTKGTFYPYCIPLLIWFFIGQLKKVQFSQLLVQGIVFVLIVVVLNAGYWSRNMITFGGPLGSEDWVRSRTASRPGIAAVVEGVTRNVLMNFPTPYEELNNRLHDFMVANFGPANPGLKDFYFYWGWNNEERASNPLHLLMVPLSISLLIVFRKRILDKTIGIYAIGVLAMFVIFSSIVIMDISGVRYQLPFFVAWAPVSGYAVSLINRPKLFGLVSGGILLLIFPGVLFNHSRPLIAMQNPPGQLAIPCDWHIGCTTRSILVEPSISTLFVNMIQSRDPYVFMTKAIEATGCTNVGLQIDSHDPEYIFWWLLDAPQSQRRIETIYSFPELERYRDLNFKPCAIICTICGERKQLHGLELQGVYDNVKLFQGTTYHQQP